MEEAEEEEVEEVVVVVVEEALRCLSRANRLLRAIRSFCSAVRVLLGGGTWSDNKI